MRGLSRGGVEGGASGRAGGAGGGPAGGPAEEAGPLAGCSRGRGQREGWRRRRGPSGKESRAGPAGGFAKEAGPLRVEGGASGSAAEGRGSSRDARGRWGQQRRRGREVAESVGVEGTHRQDRLIQARRPPVFHHLPPVFHARRFFPADLSAAIRPTSVWIPSGWHLVRKGALGWRKRNGSAP